MNQNTLTIPDFSLVLLIGASGSGKSTFAAKHFRETEILSSDRFRGLVSDDENSMEATTDAFAALHLLAAIRLRRRKLVVVDATNVQPDSRKPLLELAKDHDALVVAIVLNLPERLCHDRNKDRPDRDFGPHVIRNQMRSLRQSMRSLRREGARYVYVLENESQVDYVQIERTPLGTDRSAEHGPFDIIGDVHGCYDELVELLETLGYRDNGGVMGTGGTDDPPSASEAPPDAIVPLSHHSNTPLLQHSRRVIFLGDLVDRGPKFVETVRLVMGMVRSGQAFVVPGNHDIKLMRYLQGKNVQMTHGLPETVAQIEALPEDKKQEFKADYIKFVDSMVSHYLLDVGKLVVAHAGMKEAYQGRASGRVRDFAIWGDTTGETDEFGLPVRYPWATEYRGKAMVVYGHTPVPDAEWLNRTINIDTGCVFGGKLTALRYPEREIVQVPAKQQYAVPAKPFLNDKSSVLSVEWSEGGYETAVSTLNTKHLTLQWSADELLRAEDVLGKRIVHTRLAGNVMVKAENSAAAFEVMSRFAVEPRWLIYLPPTMSPCETSTDGGYLEYPTEAFAYFRENGVDSVVCQTKHMGSRAVIVVCRDEQAAFRRFGAKGTLGECYTRTGRRLFDDPATHRLFLERVSEAVERSGLWDALNTDWVCIDAELMPWNAKAQGLLREQYAPVGTAAKLALTAAAEVTRQAVSRGVNLDWMPESLDRRLLAAEKFSEAYAHYCWDVSSLDDVRVAPFHLLATESKTYFDRDHAWHVETLAKLSAVTGMFMPTQCHSVALTNESSEAEATEWWLEYTGSGGEGMVVKPATFIVRGERGLVQPAVKVRGKEHLRIIYGPEYDEPENLNRLKRRALGTKRGLAAREFALGVEGLEQFVRMDPLRLVHECAFAVLALESEPVDPRL